jgi:methionine synthase II (cobalamin-independent)
MLKGLATGIGSLPHQDAESALDLIFQYTPRILFWPQLPKRDIREGMLAQYSENIPFIKVSKAGPYFSSLDAPDAALERFYEHIISQDTDYFKIGADFALGLHKFYQRLENEGLERVEFIKCQITGPFSLAAGLKDEKGVSLLHDAVFMQALVKGLSLKALWQIKLFRKFGKKIILFIDEPYLGCFGSAYTPVNREDVVAALGELTAGIRAEDVLIGVHCCGNTDWSIFTDIADIKIISFDAFSFLERFVLYADSLKKLLERGGLVCWGIVPTQEPGGTETADSLVKKILEGVNLLVKKGIGREVLLNNLLISPSCGLGTLDVRRAQKVFKLLAETSGLIQKTA